MPSIKFSHRYKKLHKALLGQALPKARLLEIINVRLEDLSHWFIAYDTDDGEYELPKTGDYMMLIFEGESGIFTTIRRRTDEKEKYYRSLIGNVFDLIIPPL